VRDREVEGMTIPIIRTQAEVKIIIHRGVLDAIVSECEKFSDHETGGALVGTYCVDSGILVITVSGVIEAGPKARRTAVSFFKDGDYQERRFREIERQHPEIEHLGNWHTHHMNGLATLSTGDVATYQKHVNSPNHNTDFWYAFLVTSRQSAGPYPDRRASYTVRHFMLYRGDRAVYTVPGERVVVVDCAVLSVR
jgi:integrative and conjugative element protein (TIGR02256 family)